MRKSPFRVCLILVCVSLIFSCSNPAEKHNDPRHFHNMLENYWQGLLKLQPLDATMYGDSSMNDQFVNNCTQAYRNEVLNFYKSYSDSLKKFNPERMSEEDHLSYEILDYDIKTEIERSKYPGWKFPFTQMGDPGNTLSANIVLAMGQFGSGESAQPFHTVKDYENWLKRISAYSIWCDSAIGNFRAGMNSNYVMPKALVVKMIDICKGLVSEKIQESIFWGPIKNIPADFSDSDKLRLNTAYSNAISNQLNPAHKKLADFLSNEYLPKARNSAGLSDLPGGMDYYKFCVKYWTTTDESLDDIYNTGLAEVKRIREEMEGIKNSTGFKGSLNSFFNFMRTDKQFMPFKTAEEVLDSFRHIYSIIQPNLKKYFVLFPTHEFEIRQTEVFRAASASIEYMPGSPDGKRPGIFYVPVLNPSNFNITSGMESTFLHEAVPGHHYQGSLQMENDSLPTFRKFKWYGAYGEGWALYAESLGKELGLYTNPFQHMGALGDEMHRAVRLVVDVAIHSKGMTREQAIAYMMDNEPVDVQAATAEIERYMAIPGQALSYKIGALKIKNLRNKYSTEQGSMFSIGEFHKQVLKSGCLPLSVMENMMDKWSLSLKSK